MPAQFQQTVDIYNPLGIPGELAFSGPHRSEALNIYSNGVPNYFGNAYTLTSPATAQPNLSASNAGTAQVGGTGVFAGLMTGVKQAYLSGTTSGGPLGASLAALDYSVQQLTTMGYVFANIPSPANVGDLVTYDPLTGNLNTIAPIVNFTGAIAAGGSAGVPDVLTVTLMQNGTLGVGSIINGAGVETATILSLGTGLGGNGTYNLSTINQQNVSAVAMTAKNIPAPAFVITTDAYIVGTTLTVSGVASGELAIGQQLFATGILPNTVITEMAAGTNGGAGTYTVNNSQTLFSSGTKGSFTGPANLFVPNATIDRYAGNTSGGGLAVIKLTN